MSFLRDDPSQRPDPAKPIGLPTNTPSVPKEYQGLLDANPYMNLNYNQSPWQKLLSRMGFRTDYDAYRESMQVQANEYNAAVAEKAYNEQYESAGAAAARERAAGLNPDLIGTGIDEAGAASGLGDDGSPPTPSQSDMAQVGQFANMIMTGFSTAIGFAKDLGSLSIMNNDVASGRISNSKNLMEMALDAILGASPANPMVEDGINPPYMISGKSIAEDAYNSFAPGLLKRDQRRFRKYIDQYIGSIPLEEKAYAAWRKRLEDRKEYFTSYNSSDYRDEDGLSGEFDVVLSKITNRLGELDFALKTGEKDIKAAEQGVKSATLANEQTYQEGLYPEAAAEAANAVNQNTAQQKDMRKHLDSALADILKDLSDLADSNKRGHNFARILLTVFSLMSMMNFSSGSTSGPFGQISTSSIGW